jgi:hypothetical protein
MDPNLQINIFRMLPLDLGRDFLRTGCGQEEYELLADIAEEAAAGVLSEAEAKGRVDEFVRAERTRASWGAGVGWGGAITLGGADLIHMANEAADAVITHPAIAASMDILASGGAVAALGTGIFFSLRLRRLPSRQTVLRRCARTLVRGVNR